MNNLIIAFIVAVSVPATAVKEVHFYSEGIRCYGKIFLPANFSAESKLPAVVVAPGWEETTKSVEEYGAHFAEHGIVAMVIDYRGWGRSGGYLEVVDDVRTDDRLRFSQMTAKVRIRRKRLLPEQQVLDIRNALYYLQGEPGVDRSRVGVWGTGMSGSHAVVIAATDARVKAIVAQTSLIPGRDIPRRARTQPAQLLIADQKRARSGQILRTNETRLALNEYHPFWYVDQIPEKTAVLFLTSETGAAANSSAGNDPAAASKLLKGPTSVIKASPTISESAKAAAAWFLKYL